MATVDDRVVAISFEASKFQQGVSQTMSSLDGLSKSIKNVGNTTDFSKLEQSAGKVRFSSISSALDNLKQKFTTFNGLATTGLSGISYVADKLGFRSLSNGLDHLKDKFKQDQDAGQQAFSTIERSAGEVRLSGLQNALDGVRGKFSVLSGAASVALGNIVSRATMAGTSLVKSLTIDPIKEGFKGYETQINAVQTILANTGLKGKKGLGQVTGVLKELQDYANKTVYNFSEMAKNIGTFTAAGVDLKTATSSIKGIANLAALSGSNSQQASGAMYQLSQAIASGRVNLQDWNSVVNAGIGGKVFQKAIVDTAVSMGTLKASAVKSVGPMKQLQINGESFRNSISAKSGQPSYLTSGVLTKALSTFTGDLSAAQLQAQGFDKKTAKALASQGKVASDAATKIKTFSQMTQALKEEVATAFGNIFKTVFGNINQAKSFFSGLHNSIQNFLTNPIINFNKTLEAAVKLGARKDFLAGLKNAAEDLKALFKPIKEAFRDIFPAKSAKSIADAAKNFKELTDRLKIGSDTAENLKRTFKGVFAIFDIFKQVIGGIFTAVSQLFGTMGKGSGGLLHFSGNVGDLIVKLDQWLKQGDRLKDFFAKVGQFLAKPIDLLIKFGDAVAHAFGHGVTKDVNGATTAVSGFSDILGKLVDTVGPKIKSAFEHAFGKVKDIAQNGIGNIDWNKVFSVAQVGIGAALVVVLKKAIGGGLGGINFDFGLSKLKGVTAVLDTLKGSLVSFQGVVKSATLIGIATALAILTASVAVLSSIDPKKIAAGLGATAVGIGEMMGAIRILTGISGKGGVKSLPVIAGSLILIATAMDVLVIAVKVLSTMDWESLGKGLAGMMGLVAVLGSSVALLKTAGPEIIVASAGMILLGVAMNIMAGAMKIFATMKWEDMGKGLAAIAGIMVTIGWFAHALGPELLIIGPGLLLMGIGLSSVAGTIAIFGQMSWGTIIKGLVGIAGVMAVMAPAMTLMMGALPGAAALTVAAAGLVLLAGAMAAIGNLSVGSIVKAIVGIGAALVTLAVGLTLMIASLPGAAALLVAAGAIAILAPAIALLGALKISTIVKGLLAIAGVLAVLAIGGIAAAPGIVALGLGIAVLGAGVLALGAGVKLLADGLSIIGSTGQKSVAVMIAAITGLVAVLPKIVVEFIKGIVDSIGELASVAPKVAEAMVKIINTMLDVVIKASPKMAQAAGALIMALIKILNDNSPAILSAGFKLLVNLLTGISQNIGKITSTVADIITKFLDALSNKIGRLVAAGANFLSKFLSGIADNIGKVISAGGHLVVKLLEGFANNLGKIVVAAAQIPVKFISGIGQGIGDIIDAGGRVIVKLIKGVSDNFGDIIKAGTDAAVKFISGVANAGVRLENAGANAVIKFLNGTARVIRGKGSKVIDAGFNIAEALIEAIIKGLAGLPGRVQAKIGDAFSHIHIPHIKLPDLNPLHAFGSIDIASSAVDWSKAVTNAVPTMTDAVTNAADQIRIGWKSLTNIDEMTSTMEPGVRAFAARMSSTISIALKSIFSMFKGDFGHSDLFFLGQYLVSDFKKGLTGSEDDINSAFEDLRGKFIDEQKKIYDEMTSIHTNLQGAIDKFQKDSNKKIGKGATKAEKKKFLADKTKLLAADEAEITAAQNLVNKKRALSSFLEAVQNDTDHLFDGLGKQKDKLIELSKSFDDYQKQIDEAQSKLDTLKSDKDSFVKSTTDQYDTLPAIEPTTSLKSYTKSLTSQIAKTEAYIKTLAALRALGLDDQTYRKLLQDGPVDQKFADQLLKSGQEGVNKINALDQQLATDASGLGQTAGSNLYDVGINAAQSFLDGLKNDQKGVADAMATLADAMIKAIKDKLGIQSPSKVMTRIGRFTGQGVVNGLKDTAKSVADAAGGVGDVAVSAMNDSLSRISDIVTSTIDPNPTITPVLDLSDVEKQAQKLSDLTNVTPITAAASFGAAVAISQGVNAVKDALGSDATGAGTVVQFEQNNYSPTALSESEIYRQTNNQLSQVKAALGL